MQVIAILFSWYIFIALLFSVYAWATKTSRDRSTAFERRMQAAGYGLAWPAYAIAQVQRMRGGARGGLSPSRPAGGAGPAGETPARPAGSGALAADLEAFGRFSYDPQSSPSPGDMESRMYARYQAGADAFLGALADIAEEYGGWAAYGAERMMVSVAGGDLRHPAYGRVMDASLSFLRANGVPPVRVTGYEWSHWTAGGGTIETWIPRRPIPSQQQAPIPPMRPGETRRVAQLTAAGDSNVLLVRCDSESRYSEIVDARWSDDDPRRSRSEIDSAPSLHGLYVRIGNSLQVPPYWCAPELEPYIPLPRPKI